MVKFVLITSPPHKVATLCDDFAAVLWSGVRPIIAVFTRLAVSTCGVDTVTRQERDQLRTDSAVVRKNVVTLPACQAGTHSASRPGLDGPPHADAPKAGADTLAAAWAMVEAAAECLAPRPCGDGRGGNVVPTP